MFFGSVSGLAEMGSGREGVVVVGGAVPTRGGGVVPERSVTGASGVVSFDAQAAASMATTMQRAALFMVVSFSAGRSKDEGRRRSIGGQRTPCRVLHVARGGGEPLANASVAGDGGELATPSGLGFVKDHFTVGRESGR